MSAPTFVEEAMKLIEDHMEYRDTVEIQDIRACLESREALTKKLATSLEKLFRGGMFMFGGPDAVRLYEEINAALYEYNSGEKS